MNSKELVQSLIDQVKGTAVSDGDALDAVLKRARMIIRTVFGKDSEYLGELDSIYYYPTVIPASPESTRRSWQSGVNALENLCKTMLEELTLSQSSRDSSSEHSSGQGYADELKQVILLIDVLMAELEEFIRLGKEPASGETALARLQLWKSRVLVQLERVVGTRIVQEFDDQTDVWDLGHSTTATINANAARYRTALLAIREEVRAYPDLCLASQQPSPVRGGNRVMQPRSRKVFVIHGHDAANRLTLEKLIKQEWRLEPVILQDEPGGSRTLIERIERAAADVGYAIALLTPDDLARTRQDEQGLEYYEARPNVLLELVLHHMSWRGLGTVV